MKNNAQANTLMAYSTTNIGDLDVRGVQIEIEKVENGFIFQLSGSKQAPVKRDDGTYYPNWESFQTTFVYQDLQEGLNEVQSFFDKIQKELDKKAEKQLQRNKGVTPKKEKK